MGLEAVGLITLTIFREQFDILLYFSEKIKVFLGEKKHALKKGPRPSAGSPKRGTPGTSQKCYMVNPALVSGQAIRLLKM